MNTIEQRIQRLEDIEAIRQLQARYQRCLDTRDFTGLGECFTPDAESFYDGGNLSYKGRENIIAFLKKVMTRHLPSAHLIHGGEIDVDGDAASAKWYLEDFLLHRIFFIKLHGAAVYDVRYRRMDDGWKISSIGYVRCFQYVELRGPVNIFSLSKTRFLDGMVKSR